MIYLTEQLTDLIQEFPGQTFEEWVTWYQNQYPDAIDNATDKIISMIEGLSVAFSKIDRALVKSWIEDLVFVKTFMGLKFQKAMLRKLDGFVGGAGTSCKLLLVLCFLFT